MTENANIILEKYCSDINAALADIVSDKPELRESVCNAMEYSLMAGGKRLRPLLTLEFCRMCGGNADLFVRTACSVELIHTFSLIHDDLPCMDNDDFRRGCPSCHKAFDEATALLAGDALNTLAFEVITDSAIEGVISPKTAVMLISALSKAVGVNGMIGGQAIDLQAENREISLEELDLLQQNKTGALIEAACVMGVILAERYDMIPVAAEYADALGRAFQIVDDILDVTGSFDKLGKPIGSDAESHKSTYVTALGIDGAQREAERLTEKALNSLSGFEDRAFLCEFTKSLLSRKN